MRRRDLLKWCAAAPVAGWMTARARAATGGAMEPSRPNLLIVHCHDLGSYLHCYGVPTVRTPHLDAFAASGVRFSRSFCAAPQCSPSRAALFTGRYPCSNGVMGLTHANFAWDLHPTERHLASLLGEAGYRTAAVGTIHEARQPARCGYETIVPAFRGGDVTDKAVGWLREHGQGGTPFYLSVGYVEPHRLPSADANADMGFLGPHFGPDDSLGVTVPGYLRDTEGVRTELAELQGAVHYVDGEFGRLTEAVHALGLEDNTLMVFTSDHGVALPRAKCNLYDPGLGVALMVRYDRRDGWRGGVVRNELVSNVDVLPTLLECLGVPVADGVQGQSFASLLDGGSWTRRDAVFGELTYHDYHDPKRCIRTDTHKLIVNFTTAPAFMDPSQSWRPRSDTVEPANHALAYHPDVELYDLTADPWELRNLAEEPALADTRSGLLTRLRAHLDAVSDPILEGPVVSPAHRRAMALLGG